MTPRNPRRGTVARTAVALATAAFGVGLIASPVQAEEAPYPIGGAAFPSDTYEFHVGWSEETQRQKAHFYIDLGDSDNEVESEDLHVVFGLADDLGGLSFETEQPGCIAEAATITCDIPDAATWDERLTVSFDVLVPPSVSAYADTDYTLSVKPGEYDATEIVGTWQFVPIDDEPESSYSTTVNSFEDVEPGASVTPEIAFYNSGETTFQDVYLSFESEQQHLITAADYRNCAVTDWGHYLCLFENLDPQPGVVHELSADTPLTVTLDENAPGPHTYRNWFNVEPVDAWMQRNIDELDFPDSGEELRFEQTDRETFEHSPGMEIRSAANPYDVAIDDRNLEAGIGSTMLDVEIRNDGPADAISRPHPGSGEGSFLVTFQLPTGVEIDGADEYGHIDMGDNIYCTDAAVNEWLSGADPAMFKVDRIDVQCSGLEGLPVGGSYTMELPVEVTDATPAADGLVVIQESTEIWTTDEEGGYWDVSKETYPVLDADLDNNVAVLGLNSDDLAGGGESPKLPTTGVSLTLVFSTAAVVLAAGVVLFILLRRRKAAAEW
ncbi:LPXTG cell wall anchor domain-containing protein [Glycomyces tarimensis]